MGSLQHLTFYSNKIFYNQTILLLSDFQLLENLGQKNISCLQNSPNIPYKDLTMILIVGDIVEDVDTLKNLSFQKTVLETMKKITGEIPTFYTLGNHDKMTKQKSHNWERGEEERLIDLLSSLPYFQFVDYQNTFVTKDNLAINGLSLPFSFFERENEKTEFFFQHFYKQYRPSLFSPKHFNIFMLHQPQGFIEGSLIKKECMQPYVDISVFGHMHNGMVPPCCLSSSKNWGLVSPKHTLFPKYARGIVETNGTTHVINGPVNTMIKQKEINDFYGANATLITIQKGKENLDEESCKVKRKVISI